MFGELEPLAQGGVLMTILGLVFMIFQFVVKPLVDHRKAPVNGKTKQLDEIQEGVQVLCKQHDVYWPGTQTPVWHNPPKLLDVMESINHFLNRQDKHLEDQEKAQKDFTGSYTVSSLRIEKTLTKIDKTLEHQTQVLETMKMNGG